MQTTIQETPTANNKKYLTLTHHNKSTQKIAKGLKKKLKYKIGYTTNNTLQRHFTNVTTHNTQQEIYKSTGVLNELIKSMAYSSKRSHTGQLDFCN